MKNQKSKKPRKSSRRKNQIAGEFMFEIAAVELMMLLPTPLNKAWANATDAELAQVIPDQLELLGLSTKVRDVAEDLVAALSSQRAYFRAVAIALRDAEYDGKEPHPIIHDCQRIVIAMQNLDALARQKRS